MSTICCTGARLSQRLLRLQLHVLKRVLNLCGFVVIITQSGGYEYYQLVKFSPLQESSRIYVVGIPLICLAGVHVIN